MFTTGLEEASLSPQRLCVKGTSCRMEEQRETLTGNERLSKTHQALLEKPSLFQSGFPRLTWHLAPELRRLRRWRGWPHPRSPVPVKGLKGVEVMA